MNPTATASVRCRPDDQTSCQNAANALVNDPEFRKVIGLRLGEFDEAPVRAVSVQAVGTDRVDVVVYGNLPYFDGEREIMESHCRHIAGAIRSAIW